MPENEDKAMQLLETRTEIAGAVVGGALGFMAAGIRRLIRTIPILTV